MTGQETVLSVRDLSVRLPRDGTDIQAVRNVSFDLRQGEMLGIAGESGSGKSMTLMAILGLLPRRAHREAESIHFAGQRIDTLGPAAMRSLMATGIATIFQDPMTCLNPVMTVGSLLEEVYLTHFGGARRVARDRAVDMLERVGIPEARKRLNQYPHELSGGLRQRVMIAMALICEPKVLFADEPTTALDVTVQKGILDLILELRRDIGLAVVFVSHDLGVIYNACDRVAVMYGGEIVETGPVGEILSAPTHPYTAALIRCIPRIESGPRGRLSPIPGQVKVMSGDLQGCQFRERCPIAIDSCATQTPPLVKAGPDRWVRCPVRTDGTVPELHP
ncbi:ABC transporter ATP-binding protein [Rhodobacteraceae bacterium CCMM004]|nr:ABC transporter ATP-binding protein [Rhodobacteraceae bacterium CCMM004]